MPPKAKVWRYEDVAAACYPSVDELLARWDERHLIPENLRQTLRNRWANGASEYPTGKLHEDGRHINACMENNSYAEAAEEVVDALFNLLVANFKKPFTKPVDKGMISMCIMLYELLEKRK